MAASEPQALLIFPTYNPVVQVVYTADYENSVLETMAPGFRSPGHLPARREEVKSLKTTKKRL